MNCPACGNELTTQNVNEINLNACAQGCGGIWLDWPELNKFDKVQDSGPEGLVIEKDEKQVVNQSRRYSCPHCDDIVMARHFVSTPEDVLVDECPSCGGLWLNGDELDEIRAQFEDASYTVESAEQSGPKAASTDRQNMRVKRFINVIRFLCPSQYVA